MKKPLAITLITLLGLALFFSSAFAFGSAGSLEAAKPTAKANKTPEIETPEPRQDKDGQGNQPAGKQKAGKKYNFSGMVVSYTSEALVLTDKRGETISVALNANTLIKTAGSKNNSAEILPDMKVSVQAVKTEEQTFLALRVTVAPGKPQQIHRVGEVSAYDGSSITVTDAKGSTTFQIAPDVKILPEERASELIVGARVTVISPRDPAGGSVVAKGIVIHPAK